MARMAMNPPGGLVERMRRVMQLWGWLPGFRAIAETEHLTRAAQQLHVTPPALSRTLRILEEDLGVSLFERQGRHLVLNPAGRRLLSSVRIAMRLVHDALQEVEGERQVGLTVASSGVFTLTGLDETLLLLLESHPHVQPTVRTSVSEDPGAELLQGHLDLLFTSSPLYRDGLTTVTLTTSALAVFCGPSHPLYGRSELGRDDVLGHVFVAPPCDPAGRPIDGWPADWPRQVAIVADRQSLGLGLCLSGRMLAVLPEVVTRTHPQLWRLPLRIPGSTDLLAIHRVTTEPGPVEAAVAHAAGVFAGREEKPNP
jgi:DNA-binding transcriptional LysR family regulator